tara:strand:- start:571 stop:2451 length:1881 start_codon:yes stop_codon:yes gene_type:complete
MIYNINYINNNIELINNIYKKISIIQKDFFINNSNDNDNDINYITEQLIENIFILSQKLNKNNLLSKINKINELCMNYNTRLEYNNTIINLSDNTINVEYKKPFKLPEIFITSIINNIPLDLKLDNIDNNIEISNNFFIANKLGNFDITYTVKNNNFTFNPYILTVNVIDTIKPYIELIGDNEYTIDVFSEFIDPGIKTFDLYDSNLLIETISDLCCNIIGSYNIEYISRDTNLNVVKLFRTIHVVDKIKPVLTMEGNQYIILKQYSEFIDPGVSAYDRYFGDLSVNITSDLCTNIVGEYNIVYYAKDFCNNDASCVRYISIKHLDPEIDIIGDVSISLEVNTNYIDLGVRILNNRNNYNFNITHTSDLCMNILGQYKIAYNAIDLENNIFLTTERHIYVIDTTKPSIYLIGNSYEEIYLNFEYHDPGITVIDNYDKNPKSKSISTIDITNIGKYKISYYAWDSNNNYADVKERNIIVKEYFKINSNIENFGLPDGFRGSIRLMSPFGDLIDIKYENIINNMDNVNDDKINLFIKNNEIIIKCSDNSYYNNYLLIAIMFNIVDPSNNIMDDNMWYINTTLSNYKDSYELKNNVYYIIISNKDNYNFNNNIKLNNDNISICKIKKKQ